MSLSIPEKWVKLTRETLLQAARDYADETSEVGGQRTAPLELGAKLRLAAKAFRKAEREAGAK
jgi:hypothetical protein